MIKNLRLGVLLIPCSIFITLIVVGIVNPDGFISVLNTWFEALMSSCGWMVSIGMIIMVGFMVVLLFHPIGKIKLGGPNAKPKMTYWRWFAIALCAGIGTGIVFWGSVEPLLFTMQPAPSLGLEAGSDDAVIWAMRTSFLHWSFTPYAIYVTFGVIIAYAYYNMRKPFNVSSGFVPMLGTKATKGKFAGFIDTLTVFAITGGVAGSLGYGLLQLASGLNMVFGISSSVVVYSGIALAIVVGYTLSSTSGLKKGIAWLSDKNAWIFIFLMLFVLVFGPTAYIFNLFTQSTGSYFTHFLEGMTYTAPFTDSELWPQWWDMYWWVDWLSFGPIVGLFCVRLGYGRTIRQFVIVNWLLPSAFAFIWFSVFGGVVLHAQLFEGLDIFSIYTQQGAEALTFSAFDLVPLAKIIKPIMIITIALSFVTLADSMTSTISTMSLKENHNVKEAPISLKVFWGITMGLASLVFTLTGGIDGIKMVKTFAGFPILFVGLFMLGGFIWYMHKRPKDADGKYVYEDEVIDAPDDSSEVEVRPTWLERKFIKKFRE